MKKMMILLILASQFGCSNRPGYKTGLEGKPIPTFDLLLQDSSTNFNTANIPAGKPVVLFLFGPNCPYSKAEMADIIESMDKLSNIRFYIFTGSPFMEMKRFSNQYHLQKYHNIVVGVDQAHSFQKYFQATAVPYVAVYDPKKNLKQVLLGSADANTIREATQE